MASTIPTSNTLRLARLFFSVVAASAVALAGCAVDDGGSEPAADEASETSSSSLISTSGGPSNGFSCDQGTCTCSKTIEGDCDRMRKNCVGSTEGLDNCLKGWLTTDCTCSTALVVKHPPIIIPRPPVGGVFAP